MSMNRKQRREMSKGNPKIAEDLSYLNTPVTIAECVQLARGVAQDVVADYQKHTSPMNVALSLQVELLKEVVMKAGLVTEEEFKAMYMQKAKEFEDMQRKAMSAGLEDDVANDSPKMNIKSNDIEIKTV